MDDSAALGEEMELGAAQLRDWLACVRRVPVCLLEIRLAAETTVHFDRFPGSKLNGALWGWEGPSPTGLARVAADHPQPELRALARWARARHERMITPAGYHEKPFVLGLESAGSLHLEAGEPYAFTLLLFGEMVMAWPAFVEAAARLELQPGRLRRLSYRLWTPTESWEEPPLEAGIAPALTLGDLAGARSFGEGQAGRLTFVTPVLLTEVLAHEDRMPTAEPLVVSALANLGASWSGAVFWPERGLWVTPRRPGRAATIYLRRLAAQAYACAGDWYRVEALLRQASDGQLYAPAGVMGELLFPALPAAVAEVLHLAQFTHLGQHSAYGLGRYRFTPA